MASTYTLIQKITVPANASPYSGINFTNIPQTYTDLVIKYSARGTQSAVYATTNPTFNGVTSNQNSSGFFGNGTSGSFGFRAPSNPSSAGATASANIFNNCEIRVHNYTSTRWKSFIIENATGGTQTEGWQEHYTGLYTSTSPVTSFGLSLATGNFVEGSTFYLYGISSGALSLLQPKATGGDQILYDGTFYYHIFFNTGLFTPNDTITCNYLVVAGGGGGGFNWGGGGGAGGLRSTVTATGGGGSLESPIGVNALTSYPILVGAGGAGGVAGTNAINSLNGNTSTFAHISSIGGGRGGSGADTFFSSSVGGSGGAGGRGNITTGSAGTSGQGFAGGSGDLNGLHAGGGGGAGAVGNNNQGSSASGNGGAGVATSISGTSVTYAGGGGGGGLSSQSRLAGAGGSGGGGAGAYTNDTNGVAGTSNTGSGGGGGAGGSPGGAGGNGGSGIVIIRYS